MFDFRIIEGQNGSQVIDTTLKTPYEALTPLQMLEYIDVDRHMAIMERMKRKQSKEAKRKRKFIYKFLYKVVCICGIM